MNPVQTFLESTTEILGIQLEGQWLILGADLTLGGLSLFCFGAWLLRDPQRRTTGKAGNALTERTPRRTQKWLQIGIVCLLSSLLLLGIRLLLIREPLSRGEWLAGGGLAVILIAVIAEGTFLLLPLFTSKKQPHTPEP